MSAVASGREPTDGEEVLRSEGYRLVAGVRTVDDDFDMMGHVNNAAIARWFNQHRMRYGKAALYPQWSDHVRDTGMVVVAKEVHILYESEGMPGESFVCGTRVAHRRGKAVIVEQRVVEAGTGRSLARAWVVELLAKDGASVDYPDSYWQLVEAWEQREIPDEGRVPRAAWGP